MGALVPDTEAGPPAFEHSEDNGKGPRKPDPYAAQVREVFAYWQTATKHPQAKLSPERERKIRARLRDGVPVEQIKRAIDGCAASEFHKQGKHTDIELICRNAVKLDAFCAMATVAPEPDDVPVEYRYTCPDCGGSVELRSSGRHDREECPKRPGQQPPAATS